MLTAFQLRQKIHGPQDKTLADYIEILADMIEFNRYYFNRLHNLDNYTVQDLRELCHDLGWVNDGIRNSLNIAEKRQDQQTKQLIHDALISGLLSEIVLITKIIKYYGKDQQLEMFLAVKERVIFDGLVNEVINDRNRTQKPTETSTLIFRQFLHFLETKQFDSELIDTINFTISLFRIHLKDGQVQYNFNDKFITFVSDIQKLVHDAIEFSAAFGSDEYFLRLCRFISKIKDPASMLSAVMDPTKDAGLLACAPNVIAIRYSYEQVKMMLVLSKHVAAQLKQLTLTPIATEESQQTIDAAIPEQPLAPPPAPEPDPKPQSAPDLASAASSAAVPTRDPILLFNFDPMKKPGEFVKPPMTALEMAIFENENVLRTIHKVSRQPATIYFEEYKHIMLNVCGCHITGRSYVKKAHFPFAVDPKSNALIPAKVEGSLIYHVLHEGRAGEPLRDYLIKDLQANLTAMGITPAFIDKISPPKSKSRKKAGIN